MRFDDRTIKYGGNNNTELYSYGVFDGDVDSYGESKMSVEHARDNEAKIKRFITGKIISFSDSIYHDTQDVFQRLILDLYQAEDFNPLLDNSISNVGGYVYNRLSYVIKSFITEMYEMRKNRYDNVPSWEDEDGMVVDLVDTLESKEERIDELVYDDVYTFLDELSLDRYRYGLDVMQVIYIHVVASKLDMDLETVYEIVALLNNIDCTSVSEICADIVRDKTVGNAVSALYKSRNIYHLERYIHGLEQINNLIRRFNNKSMEKGKIR